MPIPGGFADDAPDRFRIRVRNDTLAPQWRAGDWAEFETVDPQGQFCIGQDYYIETAEGATFKRVLAADNQALAIATADAGKTWNVLRHRIKRAAIAVFVLQRRDDTGVAHSPEVFGEKIR